MAWLGWFFIGCGAVGWGFSDEVESGRHGLVLMFFGLGLILVSKL